MKNIALIIVLLATFACGVDLPESDSEISEIRKRDFSTISVDDARVLAKRAGDTGLGGNARAFVDAAMESGRVEIMTLCWENRYISAFFFDVYRKLPEGDLKNQLFSSRLRSNRMDWPEESPSPFTSGNEELGNAEFVVPVLRKYIPDLPMNYSVMNSREKRQKLADVFDKAVGIPIVVEPEARRVWPPKSGEKPNMSAKPDEPRDNGGKANAPAIAAAVPIPFGGRLAIGAAVAAVLAGIAGWLALRSRVRR